jgi:hypothetical protein
MNKQFPLFLFAIVVVLSCNRCKEECDDPTNPECPNYVAPVVINPCEDAAETSADFEMYQELYPVETFDTLVQFYHDCMLFREITLHALQDSAEYHWIIGADHYYTREVNFNFGAEFVGQEIPLILVVSRQPDTACFPNDNGIDTLVKTIMPKYFCDASIWGKYYGAWDESPLDSFIVELYLDFNNYPDCNDNVYLAGLNPILPDTCTCTYNLALDNYYEFEETPTSCYDPIGSVSLDSTLHNVIVDYSLSETNINNFPRLYHIFRGYRLN